MYSTTVSNEMLIITDGSAPTLSTSTKAAVTTVTAALASNPIFTGTSKAVTVSGTPEGTITSTFYGAGRRFLFSGTQGSGTVQQGTVTASGTFTPTGTIGSSFSGTGARLVAAFTGSSMASTGNWPTLGASFTGTKARLKFTGTQTSFAPTVQQGTVTASGTFTPAGTINSTFTGSGIYIKGDFSGKNSTFTGSYTPTGTIDRATFTGSGIHIEFTGTTASIAIG